jgi:hypothetical protein
MNDINIRITAYDKAGRMHRVTIYVPRRFTEDQAKAAATKVLGFEVVRVEVN